MVAKYPLNAQRVRKVPPQFSWVDQRVVRQRRLAQCSVEGAALYLFLVTVADVQGLSYYGDTSIAQHLGMDVDAIANARNRLIQTDLIAYKKPLYQILSLDDPVQLRSAMDRPLSLGQVLQKAIREGS